MIKRTSFLMLGFLLATTAASAGTSAGWLLERARGGDLPGVEFSATDDVFTLRQTEFGATGVSGGAAGVSTFLPVALSAAMPGAGEVFMGVVDRRWGLAALGSAMMAMDVYGWKRMSHFRDEGERIEAEYFAYADEHWSLDQLDGAFDLLYHDEAIAGVGLNGNPEGGPYYENVSSHEDLSLWVSEEDDRREYYENLGKWNQFVFGWDDFSNPADGNLSDPAVSAHREIYRGMRTDSNSAFQSEDRWLYFNILMRVTSVAHVAWRQGWFGGNRLEVAGHQVEIEAVPRGLRGGRLGVNVSW